MIGRRPGEGAFTSLRSNGFAKTSHDLGEAFLEAGHREEARYCYVQVQTCCFEVMFRGFGNLLKKSLVLLCYK